MASTKQYNLQASLKALKKKAQTFFTAGYSPAVTAGMLKLSPELVTGWHDEFVREVLRGSPTKRLFLREMLLKNAPQMIMILVKLAQNEGDEKLAYSAATSVLSFGSRFMNEDMKIKAVEDAVMGDGGTDPMLERGLFDFVDPDHEAQKQMQISETSTLPLSDLERKFEEELLARLTAEEEEDEGDDYEGSPPPAEDQDVGFLDGLDLEGL